jgi:hypothetical protein
VDDNDDQDGGQNMQRQAPGNAFKTAKEQFVSITQQLLLVSLFLSSLSSSLYSLLSYSYLSSSSSSYSSSSVFLLALGSLLAVAILLEHRAGST